MTDIENPTYVNTRIKHKHDIEANWMKAKNFIPLPGELIVYDYDTGRKIKIGDGVTNVNLLPFVETDSVKVLASYDNIKIGNGTNGKNTKITLLEDGTLSYDASNNHLSTPSTEFIRLDENTSITLSDFSVEVPTSGGYTSNNRVYADIFCSYDYSATFSKLTLSSGNKEFKPGTSCRAVVCVYTEECKDVVTQAGNQVEITTYAADADTLYNNVDLVINHYEQHELSDHIGSEENPHRVRGAQLEDYDDFVLKNKVYEANTENVVEVIKNAQAGSTIQLTPGNYNLLKLYVTKSTSTPGKSTIYTKPFADNITIKGTEGAVVAGIDISGCYKVTDFSNQVNEGSELSKNLSIEDLEIAGSLCIGNCIFDGLSIKRCHLTSGGITVTPNSFVNSYHDRVSDQTDNKYLFQSTRGKNLSIRHCTIDNYDEFYKSAIYVHTCDDIEIYQNTVTDGGSNAITVRGSSATTPTTAPTTNSKTTTTSACKGKITIHNNSIYNASNYGVYVTELQDASVQVLRNNFYYGDGTGTYVRILKYENSYITTRRMNANSSNGFHNLYKYKEEGATKYTDVYLLPDKGISISDDFSYARKSELTTLTNTVSSNKTSLTNSINSAKSELNASINELNDSLDTLDNKVDNHISYNIAVSTSDNLSTIIKNAKDGTTITLADGEYPRLNLFGNKSFRNNITIKGSKNAIIDGMSISSGIRMAQELQDNRESDIRKATMSSYLTIEGVTFAKSFCVKNCIIEGVSVVNCKFEEGAGVYIVPNSPYDVLDKLVEPDEMFGYGDGSATFENVPFYNTRVARNVMIKGCEFMDCNLNSNSTAIYMKTIDGAYVTNNLVHASNFNGVQITGNTESYRTKGKSTGKIVITNNDIRNTGSRSIRLSFLENAYVLVQFNTMSGANLLEDNGNECIKISNLDTTNTIVTMFNYTTNQGGIKETNSYVVRDENGEITSSQLVAMGTVAKTSYIYLDQKKTSIESSIESIQSNLSNLSNVENKSSAQIRNEITSENIINALQQDAAMFKGDKGDKGDSGVYIGSGEMPEGYNVQIDPNGTPITYSDLISSIVASLPVYNGEVL